MRFLLYNIRYATGGSPFLMPWSGYFGRTTRTLDNITHFIQSLDPDIVGLVEVDAGSYRTGWQNQAEAVAHTLGHYHVYNSKYRETGLARMLPVLSKQGNAFLARDAIKHIQFHYFERGVKRLVIELELDDLTVFLVHLSLGFRIRHSQLGDLYTLVRNTKKPHIVAGDFNAFRGDEEIRLFLGATGLINADPIGRPTYPSWKPHCQLDFILHSPDIRINAFDMPRVTYSDHLPLVCDFDITG